MKRILLLGTFSVTVLLVALVYAFNPFAKEKEEVCCSIANGQTLMSFANLANNKSFVQMHQEPKIINYKPKFGDMITFPTPDGKEGKAFMIKNSQSTDKYVLVFQEWWGLNDHIKKESEKLFADLGDVNVIALDMYDGVVATTREEAMAAMQSVTAERGSSIVKGALNLIGANAKVATIGWCFGGSWSLQASLIAGSQSVACVIYYGMPEKNMDRLATLQAEVLGIFAGKEKYITTEIVNEFEANLKTLNKKATIKSFDAEHAFANPSNPAYDSKATEEAYAMTLKFLEEKL